MVNWGKHPEFSPRVSSFRKRLDVAIVLIGLGITAYNATYVGLGLYYNEIGRCYAVVVVLLLLVMPLSLCLCLSLSLSAHPFIILVPSVLSPSPPHPILSPLTLPFSSPFPPLA